MTRKKATSAKSIVLVWVVSTIVFSCAKSPYINVDYRPQNEQSAITIGKPVTLEAVDLRPVKDTLNRSAQKKFTEFSEQFTLNEKKTEDQLTPLGNYTVPELFETAFEYRLKKLGVQVSAQPMPETLQLQIQIDKFQIHLVEGDWLADIGYRASLVDGEKRIAGESVTGSAQRLKGIGKGGAEKVIGEIFTDAVNRLNLERLFAKVTL
jgi:hypothetical protein